MRKKSCNNCGVARHRMILAKVLHQPSGFLASTYWLCYPCLLKAEELLEFSNHQFKYDEAMKVYKPEASAMTAKRIGEK